MAPGLPTLAIVIPALNESAHLPYLLNDLGWQKNIQFEVIVVDGGSTDNTLEQCREFAKSSPYEFTFIETKPGRAHQMNKGAELGSADELLFLHADSRIREATLLSNAQKFLTQKRQHKNSSQISGHFPLKFLSAPGTTNNYYFYESKTYLNKADCVNGDQGFWITQEYFNELGKFDESLPYMEDAKLALKIANSNNWITLPGEIETSARRFETEGFTNRQILNSFLCNFNAMGEQDYFKLAGEVYKQQNLTQQLDLKPYLKLTHQYMNSGGLKAAFHRWYQTGAYISSNAWQLAFAYDCKKNKKQGLSPNANDTPLLKFYEKYIASAANWPIIKLLTGLFTIVWFYSLFLVR